MKKIFCMRREGKMQEFTAFIKSRQKANFIIVAINILVFIGLSFLGDTENGRFLLQYGANFAPLVKEGEYYRLFTSMFLHFGFEHLCYNMLVLIFLGDTLERVAGKVRYLVIYLGGGLAGNVVSCYLDFRREEYAISAGASGAIFAVIGALVFLVVKKKGDVAELSGRRLLLMAGLSILQGFTASRIDNSAHVGGFIAGFILAFLIVRVQPKRDYC